MTNPALRITALAKSYGRTVVLRDIDLALAPGAIVALLGPSGCGKTTLLRLVAGFEAADGGTIEMGGRDVATPDAWVPPHRRGIGYVPQEGALFPHLSVAGNIGFGLSRADKARGRIGALLSLIDMEGFGARMPHELSGGQQQRVALARALAPSPDIVLLDEPFNALDGHLRRTLCAEVRRVLKASGTSALLVTHDRDEAFSVADEIAVMRAGRLIQCGTPAGLYGDPVDIETARQVGAVLCLPAVLAGDRAHTAVGPVKSRNPRHLPDGPVTAMLRPEQIVRAEEGEGCAVMVRHASTIGPLTWLDLVQVGPAEEMVLAACWMASVPPAVGTTCSIRIAGEAIVFPPDP